MEITKENCLALESLIRTQFLDLHKIIEMFNQKQASEFKRINAAFMEVELKGSTTQGTLTTGHTLAAPTPQLEDTTCQRIGCLP